jgi:hypothetical protein
MQSVASSALPSSPQASGAILPDMQQRSPRATWAHVQRQCDMGPPPYHSVAMTVVTNSPQSRVESSALIQSSSPRLHRLHPEQPAQPEGTVSSPLSTISPDQFNLQVDNSEHVVPHHPLNGLPPVPIPETLSVYPGAPQSANSSPYHDSLNIRTHRPRTYNQVFHSTSDLAAHHGIPQSLPPPPRTTPRRSSEPEQIPDFSLSTLCSNYLNMLASNKSSEPSSAPEDNSTAALLMSANDEAAAQAIASALSGTSDSRPASICLTEQNSPASPEFLNPNSSDFLTSPVSPWDDLLTTPALDGDMGMTPDIYTSPLMDFGDDFDNMPSLFGSTAFEGYEPKETVGSHLSPSDLPLPDMDDMYKISPGTPVIDDPSIQLSLHVDDSSIFPTRRKSEPTGTRKNVTPESLVPHDAPIQSRKYRIPSSTSRKELPATFARKRARTSGPAEDEPSVGPSVSEEDAIKAKRLQNTLAARRSRKRKLEYQRELEDVIEAERMDKEMWRSHALILEALLRDKGHEVPPRIMDA